MKWKTNKPKRSVGDTRTVRRFAWKRIQIEDETIWLELYDKEQVFNGLKWVTVKLYTLSWCY